MGRKRKMITTGVVPIGGPRLKSRREARKVTSQFHQLQNEIGKLKENLGDKGDDVEKSENMKKVKILEERIEDIGGRDRYQQASVVTTSHHSTSKWVVSVLNKLGVYPRGKDCLKLNTLEVGAINTQLQQYPGLSVRAIDINSQHPLIEEKDFFDLQPTSSYDVVVCSMVVNCVDSPVRRGDMLIRLSAHLKSSSAILFLVLPTKCIDNTFLSRNQFLEFLKAINLVLPSNDERFSRLFPNASAEVPLKSICSRVTPKLSFFVLTHDPALHPQVAQSDDTDAHERNNWFESPRFHHILKPFGNSYRDGLLDNFISHLKFHESEKKTSIGRFNSNEFSICLPPDILQTALLGIEEVCREKKKLSKKKMKKSDI